MAGRFPPTCLSGVTLFTIRKRAKRASPPQTCKAVSYQGQRIPLYTGQRTKLVVTLHLLSRGIRLSGRPVAELPRVTYTRYPGKVVFQHQMRVLGDALTMSFLLGPAENLTISRGRSTVTDLEEPLRRCVFPRHV